LCPALTLGKRFLLKPTKRDQAVILQAAALGIGEHQPRGDEYFDTFPVPSSTDTFAPTWTPGIKYW